MQLGQQLADPGIAQQGGLTQITTETPPDPGVAAENYARNIHPHQAAANDLASAFNLFLGLLNGVV
jgi:hypothetical protein